MHYSIAATFAAYVAIVAAFKDTSPYLLLSTTKYPTDLDEASTRQLQAGADVFQRTWDFLKSCPSDVYIIVSQPGLNAADLSRSKAVPHLRKVILNGDLKLKHTISEVAGQFNAQDLQDYIIWTCSAELFNVDASKVLEIPEKQPLIIRTTFNALPRTSPERATTLTRNDHLFQSILDALPSNSYTIIYTSTPLTHGVVHDTSSYVPEFVEPLHMELKWRSVYDARASNDTDRDRRPLFVKYQFFTPGLFMALFVIFILLSIVSVGVSALRSLKVSYGAFEKEMGPATQKKQQ